MLTREEKEGVVTRLRAINSDNVITGILFFLDDEFTSDSEKLHRGFEALKGEEEYEDLLYPFAFLRAFPFSYSPLLERVLQRLQETKLLSMRSPDFAMYEMSQQARIAVERDLLPKFGEDQLAKLQRMSLQLSEFLV